MLTFCHRVPIVVGLFVLVCVSGCTDAPLNASSGALPIDPERSGRVVGDTSYVGSVASIAGVVQARFGDAGAIVVLDKVAPYVKIYRNDGKLEIAVGQDGRGPGEIHNPRTLAVLGDSTFIVGHGSRLSRFTADGKYLDDIPTDGVPVLGMVATCGLKLAVFGPEFTPAGGINWLSVISPNQLTDRQSVFGEAEPPGVLAASAHRGLAGSQKRVTLWHDQRAPARLVQVDCSRPWNVTSRTMVGPWNQEEAPTAAAGESETRFIPWGRRILTGIADLEDRIVVTFLVTDPDKVTTEVLEVGEGGEMTYQLDGHWVVQDYEKGVVLLSTLEPMPHLVVVRRNTPQESG